MKKYKNKKEKPLGHKQVREGDLVYILAGNDKGHTGKVLARVAPDRVVVEGANIKTKHVKPRQSGEKGNIVKVEGSIHVSNLKLCVDPEQVYSVKTGIAEDGQKDLFYMKDGKKEIYRTIKKAKAKSE